MADAISKGDLTCEVQSSDNRKLACLPSMPPSKLHVQGNMAKEFAVVAIEVRKLAERCQVAASGVSELTSSCVSVAEHAGELLQKMVPDIAKTAELVQEISVASEEQAGRVAQINNAMLQLDNFTRSNAASSEELAATSNELNSHAQNLQQAVSFFALPDKQIKESRKELPPQKKSDTNVSIDEQQFQRF